MKTDYLALKAAGHSLFRMTNQGLDCSLVRANMERIVSNSDWFPVWTTVGADFEKLGDTAAMQGNLVSAGQLLTKAALAYHFAQYLHFEDLDEKKRAAVAKVACYTRALPLQPVPGMRLEIPYSGRTLPAVLRVPPGVARVPLALLVCGSDSSKEEHFAIEREFLARGMATLSFDGPGQGEVSDWMPMRPSYHEAVSAVIDYVQAEEGIDPHRIGVVGFGFGGMLAVSSAAADQRIRACISVSGYFDMCVMNWDDPIRSWRFAHIVGVETIAAAREVARDFTLEDWCDRLECPVLVMHGQADAGIPAAAAKKIADRIGANAEYCLVEAGVHCFHNVAFRTTPLICDWLAAHV